MLDRRYARILPVDEDRFQRRRAPRGDLTHLGGGLHLHARIVSEMTRRMSAALATHGSLTVSQIRELLETSRKYAVPFCEYMDSIGLTRRKGDQRVAGPRIAEFVGSA